MMTGIETAAAAVASAVKGVRKNTARIGTVTSDSSKTWNHRDTENTENTQRMY
jgi:hypothetical protein